MGSENKTRGRGENKLDVLGRAGHGRSSDVREEMPCLREKGIGPKRAEAYWRANIFPWGGKEKQSLHLRVRQRGGKNSPCSESRIRGMDPSRGKIDKKKKRRLK